MVEYINIFILAAIGLLYGVMAKKIESTMISGPILFVVIGLLLGPAVLGVVQSEQVGEMLKLIAEMALALVLFTDASSVRSVTLKKSLLIPKRMLLIGLPLTIILGLGACLIIFDDFSIIEAAILAVILAPTDAALGKAVVSNTKVPGTIRESLNIESGLNDGICVPILLLCLAFVENTIGGPPLYLIKALGIGALSGLGLTFLGNLLIQLCSRKGWISKSWESIILIALALSVFSLAQLLGGSGFIACFTGGLLFGVIAKDQKEKLILSAEGIGESMAMIAWTLFGSGVVGLALVNMDLNIILYAVLSLTIIRMLPVFLSLARTGIGTREKIFLGWFGPRGLASIVFTIMIIHEDLPHGDTIVLTAVITILLSVILHGITANPYVNWLDRRTGKQVIR